MKLVLSTVTNYRQGTEVSTAAQLGHFATIKSCFDWLVENRRRGMSGAIASYGFRVLPMLSCCDFSTIKYFDIRAASKHSCPAMPFARVTRQYGPEEHTSV
jgi:hypothetical protein